MQVHVLPVRPTRPGPQQRRLHPSHQITERYLPRNRAFPVSSPTQPTVPVLEVARSRLAWHFESMHQHVLRAAESQKRGLQVGRMHLVPSQVTALFLHYCVYHENEAHV